MRLIGILVFLLAVMTQSAFAADGNTAEQKSTFEAIDGFFGQYFVGPLASVMFFDIYPFDDTLALGEGVGTVVDGQKVIAFQDDAYQLSTVYELDESEVVPTLLEPIQNENPIFTWTLEIHDSQLVAIIPSGSYEQLPKVKLESLDGYEKDLSNIMGQRDPSKRYFVTTELTMPNVPVVFAQDIIDPQLEDVIEGSAPTFELIPSTVPVSIDFLQEDIVVGNAIQLTKDGNRHVAIIDRIESGRVTAVDVETEMSTAALPNPNAISLPIVVVWLVLGAVFFTFRMAFINLRGFVHAIQVTRGIYDSEEDEGEVTHFQALSSALSATVGLGNIAGVAIAISVGGPGAIFWMIIAGFLGMSSKFTECTLGQLYRVVDPETGRVSGGPMRYLDAGLKEKGMGGLGKALAWIFALMCIGGSLGGGNMFQANQSFAAITELVPSISAEVYGIALAILVGSVIIGGIKSIGKVAGIIVPFMCGVYVLAGMYILMTHASNIPHAFSVIVTEAFAPTAVAGGAIGALIQGFRRAAFSNEAGVGSASIAHSAAATDEPVREGIVALLEPFIDTIVVCTMTGLVVVITGAYQQEGLEGVAITSYAFASVIDWFPYVLSVAVFFFAFSTMISWSYYGERCVTYLFGEKASMPYKFLFCLCVIFGAVVKLGNVLDFSDLMILGMAFPNILGLFILSTTVREKLDHYWGRLQSGEMKPVR